MFTPKQPKKSNNNVKFGKLSRKGNIWQNDLLRTDTTANFRPTRRLI